MYLIIPLTPLVTDKATWGVGFWLVAAGEVRPGTSRYDGADAIDSLRCWTSHLSSTGGGVCWSWCSLHCDLSSSSKGRHPLSRSSSGWWWWSGPTSTESVILSTEGSPFSSLRHAYVPFEWDLHLLSFLATYTRKNRMSFGRKRLKTAFFSKLCGATSGLVFYAASLLLWMQMEFLEDILGN